MAIKRKAPFDPKSFLAMVGEGRSIGKYNKDKVVFSQGGSCRCWGKEAVVSAISLVLLTDRPVTIMAKRSDHNSVFRRLLWSPLQPELRDSEIWHQIFRKSFPLLRHLVEVRWQKGCRCLRHRGQKADSGRYGTDTVHRLAFIRHARDRVSASWHITSGGFSPLWLSSHLM